jgi:hypothetical protein
MSQIGTVLSTAPDRDWWIISYSYVKDDGTVQTFAVNAGSKSHSSNDVPLWSSPTDQIVVPGEGYTGNVLLNCPELMLYPLFGIKRSSSLSGAPQIPYDYSK